jgi:CYTH domain-containing protein
VKGLEIERVWVLRQCPELPPGAEVWHIEQGYLPGPAEAPGFPEGRLRRVGRLDGSTVYVHTTKRGSGLVREETERPISAEEFERWWPATAGRRIAKTRYRVREGGLIWEIDAFRTLPLVMAEVELPDEGHVFELPTWLAKVVAKDVTYDARYRNAALAMHGLPDPQA